MYEVNFNRNQNARTCPRNWDISELEARSGALVNEALEKCPLSVKAAHWEDMKQTAMLAFLTYQDKDASYGYGVARNSLKNYRWVHILGLNGGWKSLVARNYTVSDSPLEIEGDSFDTPRDNLYWRLFKDRIWDVIPRPVEWKVIARLDDAREDDLEKIFREILDILAGMSKTNWYPEQIYRAALIIAMLLTEHTWEDVEIRTGMDYREVWNIWWHYRRTRLTPYLELMPTHQEIIKMLGQARLTYFEELSVAWLNQPKRKMVVLPNGIFTIIYKRRSRKPGETISWMEASLQKGCSINGRPVVRAVSLGKVGGITKEQLLEATQRLEQKWARLRSAARSQ